MEKKKTIAIDFDGTIAGYDGWKGKGVFGKPIAGAAESLNRLKEEGWTIIIFTTRLEIDLVCDYLRKYSIPFDHINHSPETQEQFLHPSKVLADVYLDDRAIRFSGVWSDALEEINQHKDPWWRVRRQGHAQE